MLRLSARRFCAVNFGITTANNPGNPLPPTTTPRSSFKYEGAVNATDVGARNEAAYLPYKEFEVPETDIKRRLALPSLNNLLTTLAVEIGILVGFCVGTSIILWDAYSFRKYEVVRIEAPKPQ